jgi:CheY-like chemotaxis protein
VRTRSTGAKDVPCAPWTRAGIPPPGAGFHHPVHSIRCRTIIDVHLGDEDGIAVARHLRDNHPGLQLVSMSSREMDADQRRRLGGIRWYRKDGALVENLLAAFLETAPERVANSG